MDLSLNYTSESSNIKTQNSQGQIGLSLGYNGKPYDLHVIADNKITVKIGNSEGYIQDIVIDTSSENDDDKYSGRFAIKLSDPNIQNLPPDIYYLEVWINTKDAQGNQQQLIFPSENVLPFTLTSNIVNGSNSMPMITYENIQKDWASFKNFVLQRYAEIQNDFAEMDDATNTLTDKVNSGISGYANFVGSAGSNLNSLADSGSAKLNSAVTTANSNVANIDNMVESAKAAIAEAKSGVYSVVDGDVNSAEADITNVTNSANTNTTNTVNSAETTINRAANGVTEAVDTTVNSAVTRVDSAADGIKGQVGSIVSSGQNDMGNVASNYNHMVYSTASMMFHTAGSFSNEIDSAVNNVKFTVNSADNNMSNFANDIDDRTSSADTHIDRDISNADNHADSTMNSVDDHADKDVSIADSHMDSTMNSADNHMSNFASDINDRTSSADAHIDTDVSDADSHIGSHVSNADNHIDYHTGSADSHIDNKVSSGDSYISENVNSGENRITNDVNTGEDSIVTTTDSAVGRINNDTSIVSSDVTSVTNMAQKYSNNMNSQANSAYTNINNSGESVYNGINDSARNADNDINYSAKSAYTGVSASASSAYINIDGYNRSASDAISGDTSSGISAFNSAYNSASSIVQDTIDHSDKIIESDITNGVKSSVSNDFNNQAKSVQAQVVQTSNDVSTIQSNVTSLSNSTGSMAINVNNQANAHADSVGTSAINQANANMESNRGSLSARDDNLQNQINSHPNWDDENWTRNQVAPSLANSAKTEAINTANSENANLQGQINNNNSGIWNKANDLQNQVSQNKNDISTKVDNPYPLHMKTFDHEYIDLNDDQLKNPGTYNFNRADLGNVPSGLSYKGLCGYLRVISCVGNTSSPLPDRIQILVLDIDDNNDAKIYVRNYTGGNFNSWHNLINDNVINDLQNQVNNNNSNHSNNENSLQDQITNVTTAVPSKMHVINDERLDLNNVHEQGVYCFMNMTLDHAPSGIGDNFTGYLKINSGTGNPSDGTPDRIQYLILDYNGNRDDLKIYVRRVTGSEVKGWYDLTNDDRLNDLQNQINNRPLWSDENWTRNQANQAATNALNQANAHADSNQAGLKDYTDKHLVSLQNQANEDNKGFPINNNQSFVTQYVDLNNLIRPGTYSFNNVDLGHVPDNTNYKGISGYMNVFSAVGNTFDPAPDKIQILYEDLNDTNTLKIFARNFTGGSFAQWQCLTNGYELQNKIDVLSNRADGVDRKIGEAEQMAIQMKGQYDTKINNMIQAASNEGDAKTKSTQAPNQLFVYSD